MYVSNPVHTTFYSNYRKLYVLDYLKKLFLAIIICLPIHILFVIFQLSIAATTLVCDCFSELHEYATFHSLLLWHKHTFVHQQLLVNCYCRHSKLYLPVCVSIPVI